MPCLRMPRHHAQVDHEVLVFKVSYIVALLFPQSCQPLLLCHLVTSLLKWENRKPREEIGSVREKRGRRNIGGRCIRWKVTNKKLIISSQENRKKKRCKSHIMIVVNLTSQMKGYAANHVISVKRNAKGIK